MWTTTGYVVNGGNRHRRRGRVCVLACGASYALQRKLGLGIRACCCIRRRSSCPPNGLATSKCILAVDIAPRGFAWAVPVQRERPYVRIGVMCERGAGRYFATSSPGSRALGDRRRTCGSRGRRSCRSGRLSAPTAIAWWRRRCSRAREADDRRRHLLQPAERGLAAATLAECCRGTIWRGEPAGYERRWRKRLGSELRWQLLLRRIAHRLNDDDIDALFELARTDGIMPLVRGPPLQSSPRVHRPCSSTRRPGACCCGPSWPDAATVEVLAASFTRLSEAAAAMHLDVEICGVPFATKGSGPWSIERSGRGSSRRPHPAGVRDELARQLTRRKGFSNHSAARSRPGTRRSRGGGRARWCSKARRWLMPAISEPSLRPRLDTDLLIRASRT